MRGISRGFPGVRALHEVDFSLERGEIHALLGENGAGKSTLIKVLTGVHRPDAGSMALDGSSIRPRDPRHALDLGISTVYQEICLIPDLTVRENVCLGREPTRLGRILWREVKERASAALDRLGVSIDVDARVGSLSIAEQQMVAIARALDVEARILVLDEPTSSLDPAEVDRLFDVLRRLKGEGMGILFITHFIDQVYAIADRITVLRNGKRVGVSATDDLPRIDLVSWMTGKDVADAERMMRRERVAPREGEGRPILDAKGIGRPPFDLTIRGGEVLGLAGLLGSGRTETARLLFGIDRHRGGAIEVEGRRIPPGSPRDAIRAGMGFCPEDRRVEGIAADLSVRENIILALQASRGILRRMPRRRAQETAQQFIHCLGIATPSIDRPVSVLSGGNQQKVILARWLALGPRVLILDEPTRGIDVGARAEIEAIIARLCRDGMGILFISSELDEVVRTSHGVVVLRDGRHIARLEGEDVDLPGILRRIAGEGPS